MLKAYSQKRSRGGGSRRQKGRLTQKNNEEQVLASLVSQVVSCLAEDKKMCEKTMNKFLRREII